MDRLLQVFTLGYEPQHREAALKPMTAMPRAAPKPVLESTLTCPYCGFAEVGTMPLDACVYFHECGRCRAILRPKSTDCCVYCSYGSVKCPSEQMREQG